MQAARATAKISVSVKLNVYIVYPLFGGGGGPIALDHKLHRPLFNCQPRAVYVPSSIE